MTNGLKAGWLALGHNELEASGPGVSATSTHAGSADGSISSILPLLDASKVFKRHSGTGIDGNTIAEGAGAVPGESGMVEESILQDS